MPTNLMTSINARHVFGTVAILSLIAVCFALFTQYVLKMQPCPWCILQRVVCFSIAIAAAPGAILPYRKAQWISSLFVIALALAGMASAVSQHFAAANASCNLTLADKIVSRLGLNEALPAFFEAKVSCADGAATLLGMPYEFCTLALFAMLGTLAVFALSKRLAGNQHAG